jgi:hypothetical protein
VHGKGIARAVSGRIGFQFGQYIHVSSVDTRRVRPIAGDGTRPFTGDESHLARFDSSLAITRHLTKAHRARKIRHHVVIRIHRIEGDRHRHARVLVLLVDPGKLETAEYDRCYVG